MNYTDLGDKVSLLNGDTIISYESLLYIEIRGGE